MRQQRTLKRALRFAGVGLHSGRRTALAVLPAPAGSGIAFCAGAGAPPLAATIDNVSRAASPLCTRLAARSGASVSTVEHLLAALAAFGVSNARVVVCASPERGESDGESDGELDDEDDIEVPILDGSSLEFARGLARVGLEAQSGAPLRYLKVLRPVQVLQRERAAWLLPRPEALGGPAPALELSVRVNFEHKGLGCATAAFSLGADAAANAAAFARELAPARTFTFEDEVARMRASGLARGGSLANAVVFRAAAAAGGARALNAEGLRFPDEWARHKLLDCVGDLALAGRPIDGCLFATSPGHSLTHALLRELLSDARNFQLCD